METRQRHAEATVPLDGGQGETANAAALNTARQAAEGFYKAGKSAIHKSLSRDSVEFVQSVRQDQGQ